MNQDANHLTAGGASLGSPLAPGSFYLATKTRDIEQTKTKTKKPLTQISLQNRPRVWSVVCGLLSVVCFAFLAYE